MTDSDPLSNRWLIGWGADPWSGCGQSNTHIYSPRGAIAVCGVDRCERDDHCGETTTDAWSCSTWAWTTRWAHTIVTTINRFVTTTDDTTTTTMTMMINYDDRRHDDDYYDNDHKRWWRSKTRRRRRLWLWSQYRRKEWCMSEIFSIFIRIQFFTFHFKNFLF